MEQLENRCLLAFDLHYGILRETFDEQSVTQQQLLAGWDDDEYVPATAGSGQSPQLVTPAIPLFHHQVTIIPNGSLYNDAAAGTLPNEGDTTIADNPFTPRALSLFAVTDAITFPDVNPQNNEAISVAELDVERASSGQTVSATFIGTGDSETLTDTNQYYTNVPSAVIVGTQGSSGSGPIGVVDGAPTTPGWDTLAATRDDIGIHGKPIGPITEIDLVSKNQETVDNIRVFVGYLVPPTNSPPTAVDDTGITATPGQPISIPVLANDSDPNGDPLKLQSVGLATLGTAVIDPSNPDQVLYTPHAPFRGHGPDTFSYTIVDPDGAQASANVTVLVNTPPTAPDITYTIPHGTTGTFSMVAADGLRSKGAGDADNDPITFSSALPYPHLSIDQNGGFTVTANGLITGGSFLYTVSDPYTSSTGTITLLTDNTLPPDALPETYTPGHDYYGAYTVDAASGVFTNNPSKDTAGDSLTPIVFTPPAYGSVTFNQAADGSYDGAFVYTPDTPNDLVFDDTFQYALSDGYGHGAPATVHLVVPDDPPVSANAQAEYSHDKIGKLIPLGNLLQAADVSDPEGDAMVIDGAVTASFGNVVPDSGGDGGFTYVPDANHIHPSPDAADASSGLFSDKISYTVVDSYGNGTQVAITLRWADFAPVAPNQEFYLLYGVTPQGQPLQVSGNVIEETPADEVAPEDYATTFRQIKTNPKPVDPDNLPVQYDSKDNPLPGRDKISGFTIVDEPTNGQIVSMDASGDFTYQAGAQFDGEDSFSYIVDDGFASSAKAYVTIKADFTQPTLFSATYTVAENSTLGAGKAGGFFEIDLPESLDDKRFPYSTLNINVSASGVIDNAAFPNGMSIAPDVAEVDVAAPPGHAELFGSGFGLIGIGSSSQFREPRKNGGFFYVL